ncbi:response regulator transcription factor [Shewanella psychropiezotolerans]|uniref:Response regulator transcription factor n=1 Tax=Shewanella psychropiezotolerans TaxID=2593655 RepID=A0ABX5WZU3_9GAMM|nr:MULTISPECIES: response regulator transcription factor [Shewanella]MPY26217.1 response regulator transcription factor [Shewanella sp. YLB-07]QDO84624.1 response regulator transcription factor [Shewanella psychropiezotolerans]
MKQKLSVLVIDDDIELCNLIRDYLVQNGYRVNVLNDGLNAAAQILEQAPHIVILDLMLPHVDGLTICKQIRDDYHGSIIMLTALDDDIDEVTGLEVGADDYLAKPVKPRVLLAHIRAQLRHLEKHKKRQELESIPFGNQSFVLNPGHRTLMVDNQVIELTGAEYDVLLQLAIHCGEIVSREALHKTIFNFEYDGIERSIDLRISRLRNKLKLHSGAGNIIQTIRNKGYLLAR